MITPEQIHAAARAREAADVLDLLRRLAALRVRRPDLDVPDPAALRAQLDAARAMIERVEHERDEARRLLDHERKARPDVPSVEEVRRTICLVRQLGTDASEYTRADSLHAVEILRRLARALGVPLREVE